MAAARNPQPVLQKRDADAKLALTQSAWPVRYGYQPGLAGGDRPHSAGRLGPCDRRIQNTRRDCDRSCHGKTCSSERRISFRLSRIASTLRASPITISCRWMHRSTSEAQRCRQCYISKWEWPKRESAAFSRYRNCLQLFQQPLVRTKWRRAIERLSHIAGRFYDLTTHLSHTPLDGCD